MFTLGTQYYRYPTPIENDWPHDLAQIRKLGMTAVKIWLNWSQVQPSPEGFNYDTFDRLMDESHQAGLKVVIQANMYPPRWWRQEKTLASRVSMETPGDTTLCLDNSDYFSGVQSFLEKMICRYREHPALLTWDCWNESAPTMCQCPYTMELFQSWLSRRYGNINQLKERYGQADLSDWSEISKVELKELPQSLDFYRFHRQHIATLFSRLGEIYHANDPAHPVMTHDVFNGVFNRYSDRIQITPLDLHGVSLHIPQVDGDHPRFATERFMLPFSLAMKDQITQQQRKPLWVSEIFAGAQVFSVPSASPPRLDTMRLALWESVAQGATGIFFWQYRPERFTFQWTEDAGWGLSGLAGEETARTALVSEFAKSMAAVSPYLPAAQEAPALTIVTNDQTVYALHARRTPAELAQILPMYSPPDISDYSNPHAAAAFGIYRACRLGNVPVAISAWDDDWNPASQLYFPLPMQIDSILAERIRAHVAAGGTVVMETGAGFYGEDGWVSPIIPAHELHDICGVREGDTVYHSEARRCELPDTGELLMGFRTARLIVSTAISRAFFANGDVAVTEKLYGKGRIIYLAGSPGYILGTDETWSGYSLLNWLGLATTSLAGLQRVRRISDQGTLQFLFNYSGQPVIHSLSTGKCLYASQCDGDSITIQANDIAVILEPTTP